MFEILDTNDYVVIYFIKPYNKFYWFKLKTLNYPKYSIINKEFIKITTNIKTLNEAISFCIEYMNKRKSK